MSKALLIILVSASLAAFPAIAGPASKIEDIKKPQVVLISFDGAHDLAQWQRSRELASRTGARFTYFLSCVFLLSRETRGAYRAPGKSAGESNVGFAMTKQEIVDRLGQINLAAAEGHEIASHACGHFDGGKWSKAEWTREFDAFSTIMHDTYKINGILPEPVVWAKIAASVKGFRAPYLSESKGMTAALYDKGFAYNASRVSRGPEEPRLAGGMMEFSLPMIPEGPSGREIIAMDYNLFVRHSGGVNKPKDAEKYESRAYNTFRKSFDTQYAGGRIPLQIGFHFTLMNDGSYWRALERFASKVCVKSDVECISHADYVGQRNNTAPVQTGG